MTLIMTDRAGLGGAGVLWFCGNGVGDCVGFVQVWVILKVNLFGTMLSEQEVLSPSVFPRNQRVQHQVQKDNFEPVLPWHGVGSPAQG